ncbi:ABC transporter substrate-binding protein [Solicola gregarius]|uniref:ABC transporter substrate-binding protein n=1 Tax=Solicola gregarius TaxID=2908642 RepID=A0AA46TL93_9ACTN|nr:ABC transporter substrate-binding protein [Solicola gregarius]UYM07330.1 ABC transporter substrate-binding protein [Solicola gregarius]
MNFAVRRTAALLATGLFALAGCGSDSSDADSGGGATGDASAYPVTVETSFGSVEIEEPPERVVTIGFSDQDFALALGVEPVGVREFLGYDAPNRPWAPVSVRGKEIPTVGAEELDVEDVAALQPDLILGLNSYIDEQTYDLLDDIAPTVAEPETAAPTWQDQTLTTGKALGLEDEAEALVAETKQRFATVREEHPEFDGASAAFGFGVGSGAVYAMGTDDYRTGWLTDLGFELPDKSGELSEEKLEPLDQDVLAIEAANQDLTGSELFQSLDVVESNRTVDLGQFSDDFAGALGFNSPLSLPYVLEVAVPRLAAATDDDPSTKPAPYPKD